MTRRYYMPDLPVAGGNVVLPEAETQHALRVMRLIVGDSITLFDGRGNECQAVVTEAGRKACRCDAETPKAVCRELARSVHLAIALPKQDRARELIQRLTELGVSKVTPLITDRTQRPPSKTSLDKMQRAVIEACKQCNRNRLLEIASAASLADFLAAKHQGMLWIAHPVTSEEPFPPRDRNVNRVLEEAKADGCCHSAVAMIGPEGGFTDEEVGQAIAAGFSVVELGKRVYRIETAATVLAAILSVDQDS